MAKPVFVIHGIGNRDEPAFRKSVEALGRMVRREDLHFVPIFWGDLGANVMGIVDTVPGLAPIVAATTRGAVAEPRDALAGEVGRSLLQPPTKSATRASVDVGRILQDAIVEHARPPAAMTRGGQLEPAVIDAIRAAVQERLFVARALVAVGDPDAVAAIGQAIGERIAERVAPSQAVRGLGGAVEFVKDIVGDMIDAADAAAGAVAGLAGRAFLQYVRGALLPGIGELLGDIFVYQRHRNDIQARVRDVIRRTAGEDAGSSHTPVVMVAHSLGGVIAFDMAVDSTAPLHLEHLVTFGSQSALFHVLDPRRHALDPYVPDTAVRLPGSIALWTNLWEPLDPLAFGIQRVFRLHSGQVAHESQVPHRASSGLWTHSAYWTDGLLVGTLAKL